MSVLKNSTYTSPARLLSLGLTALLIALMPAIAISENSPAPISLFKANYSAKFSGLNIDAVQRLEEIEPGVYRESLVAENFLGKIDEQSTFSLTDDQQIQPTEYHYIRSVLGRTRREVQQFDWANKRVQYRKGDHTKETVLQPGQLDMITHRLQLRRDLEAGKKQFSYAVISRGKLKQYHYQIVAEEILQTAIGPLNTVKIEKVSDDNRRFTAWLANDWNYLIVKLEQSQNGDNHTLELRSAVVNSQSVVPLEQDKNITEMKTMDGSKL